MTEHEIAAPRDTERLVAAIWHTLGDIPEVYRKAVLKHASETVWQQLIEQSEQGKQAAREAGPELGAKAAAATAAIRQAAAKR